MSAPTGIVELVLVATGSAVGAAMRFGLSQWALRADWRYPVAATLAVNLSGCLAAGLLAGSARGASALWGAFVLTGFLGSYTTVSSFSLETVGLWQSGHRGLSMVYVLVSVGAGLLLAAAGWRLASP